jgi:hypothetical protein
VIVAAVAFVCYKLRRSENVADARFQISTFNSHLETKNTNGPLTNNFHINSRADSAQSTRNYKNSESGSNNGSKGSKANKEKELKPAHDIKLEDIPDDWDSPRNVKFSNGGGPASLNGSRPGSSYSGYMP